MKLLILLVATLHFSQCNGTLQTFKDEGNSSSIVRGRRMTVNDATQELSQISAMDIILNGIPINTTIISILDNNYSPYHVLNGMEFSRQDIFNYINKIKRDITFNVFGKSYDFSYLIEQIEKSYGEVHLKGQVVKRQLLIDSMKKMFNTSNNNVINIRGHFVEVLDLLNMYMEYAISRQTIVIQNTLFKPEEVLQYMQSFAETHIVLINEQQISMITFLRLLLDPADSIQINNKYYRKEGFYNLFSNDHNILNSNIFMIRVHKHQIHIVEALKLVFNSTAMQQVILVYGVPVQRNFLIDLVKIMSPILYVRVNKKIVNIAHILEAYEQHGNPVRIHGEEISTEEILLRLQRHFIRDHRMPIINNAPVPITSLVKQYFLSSGNIQRLIVNGKFLHYKEVVNYIVKLENLVSIVVDGIRITLRDILDVIEYSRGEEELVIKGARVNLIELTETILEQLTITNNEHFKGYVKWWNVHRPPGKIVIRMYMKNFLVKDLFKIIMENKNGFIINEQPVSIEYVIGTIEKQTAGVPIIYKGKPQNIQQLIITLTKTKDISENLKIILEDVFDVHFNEHNVLLVNGQPVSVINLLKLLLLNRGTNEYLFIRGSLVHKNVVKGLISSLNDEMSIITLANEEVNIKQLVSDMDSSSPRFYGERDIKIFYEYLGEVPIQNPTSYIIINGVKVHLFTIIEVLLENSESDGFQLNGQYITKYEMLEKIYYAVKYYYINFGTEWVNIGETVLKLQQDIKYREILKRFMTISKESQQEIDDNLLNINGQLVSALEVVKQLLITNKDKLTVNSVDIHKNMLYDIVYFYFKDTYIVLNGEKTKVESIINNPEAVNYIRDILKQMNKKLIFENNEIVVNGEPIGVVKIISSIATRPVKSEIVQINQKQVHLNTILHTLYTLGYKEKLPKNIVDLLVKYENSKNTDELNKIQNEILKIIEENNSSLSTNKEDVLNSMVEINGETFVVQDLINMLIKTSKQTKLFISNEYMDKELIFETLHKVNLSEDIVMRLEKLEKMYLTIKSQENQGHRDQPLSSIHVTTLIELLLNDNGKPTKILINGELIERQKILKTIMLKLDQTHTIPKDRVQEVKDILLLLENNLDIDVIQKLKTYILSIVKNQDTQLIKIPQSQSYTNQNQQYDLDEYKFESNDENAQLIKETILNNVYWAFTKDTMFPSSTKQSDYDDTSYEYQNNINKIEHKKTNIINQCNIFNGNQNPTDIIQQNTKVLINNKPLSIRELTWLLLKETDQPTITVNGQPVKKITLLNILNNKTNKVNVNIEDLIKQYFVTNDIRILNRILDIIHLKLKYKNEDIEMDKPNDVYENEVTSEQQWTSQDYDSEENLHMLNNFHKTSNNDYKPEQQLQNINKDGSQFGTFAENQKVTSSLCIQVVVINKTPFCITNLLQMLLKQPNESNNMLINRLPVNKITLLHIIGNVAKTVNINIDDLIETYRITKDPSILIKIESVFKNYLNSSTQVPGYQHQDGILYPDTQSDNVSFNEKETLLTTSQNQYLPNQDMQNGDNDLEENQSIEQNKYKFNSNTPTKTPGNQDWPFYGQQDKSEPIEEENLSQNSMEEISQKQYFPHKNQPGEDFVLEDKFQSNVEDLPNNSNNYENTENEINELENQYLPIQDSYQSQYFKENQQNVLNDASYHIEKENDMPQINNNQQQKISPVINLQGKPIPINAIIQLLIRNPKQSPLLINGNYMIRPEIVKLLLKSIEGIKKIPANIIDDLFDAILEHENAINDLHLKNINNKIMFIMNTYFKPTETLNQTVMPESLIEEQKNYVLQQNNQYLNNNHQSFDDNTNNHEPTNLYHKIKFPSVLVNDKPISVAILIKTLIYRPDRPKSIFINGKYSDRKQMIEKVLSKLKYINGVPDRILILIRETLKEYEQTSNETDRKKLKNKIILLIHKFSLDDSTINQNKDRLHTADYSEPVNEHPQEIVYSKHDQKQYMGENERDTIQPEDKQQNIQITDDEDEQDDTQENLNNNMWDESNDEPYTNNSDQYKEDEDYNIPVLDLITVLLQQKNKYNVLMPNGKETDRKTIINIIEIKLKQSNQIPKNVRMEIVKLITLFERSTINADIQHYKNKINNMIHTYLGTKATEEIIINGTPVSLEKLINVLLLEEGQLQSLIINKKNIPREYLIELIIEHTKKYRPDIEKLLYKYKETNNISILYEILEKIQENSSTTHNSNVQIKFPDDVNLQKDFLVNLNNYETNIIYLIEILLRSAYSKSDILFNDQSVDKNIIIEKIMSKANSLTITVDGKYIDLRDLLIHSNNIKYRTILEEILSQIEQHPQRKKLQTTINGNQYHVAKLIQILLMTKHRPLILNLDGNLIDRKIILNAIMKLVDGITIKNLNLREFITRFESSPEGESIESKIPNVISKLSSQFPEELPNNFESRQLMIKLNGKLKHVIQLIRVLIYTQGKPKYLLIDGELIRRSVIVELIQIITLQMNWNHNLHALIKKFETTTNERELAKLRKTIADVIQYDTSKITDKTAKQYLVYVNKKPIHIATLLEELLLSGNKADNLLINGQLYSREKIIESLIQHPNHLFLIKRKLVDLKTLISGTYKDNIKIKKIIDALYLVFPFRGNDDDIYKNLIVKINGKPIEVITLIEILLLTIDKTNNLLVNDELVDRQIVMNIILTLVNQINIKVNGQSIDMKEKIQILQNSNNPRVVQEIRGELLEITRGVMMQQNKIHVELLKLNKHIKNPIELIQILLLNPKESQVNIDGEVLDRNSIIDLILPVANKIRISGSKLSLERILKQLKHSKIIPNIQHIIKDLKSNSNMDNNQLNGQIIVNNKPMYISKLIKIIEKGERENREEIEIYGKYYKIQEMKSFIEALGRVKNVPSKVDQQQPNEQGLLNTLGSKLKVLNFFG